MADRILRWLPVTLAAVTLSACGGSERTPKNAARDDRAAIAAVEAAQIIPVVPITPQPIAFEDIEVNDLFGIGCTFTPPEREVPPSEAGNKEPASNEAQPPLLAMTIPKGGYFKLENTIVKLAPDAGSAEMPYDTVSKYDGTQYSMTLTIDREQGKRVGVETIKYPATLTIRDAKDRTAFGKRGTANCGA